MWQLLWRSGWLGGGGIRKEGKEEEEIAEEGGGKAMAARMTGASGAEAEDGGAGAGYVLHKIIHKLEIICLY